MPNVIALLPSDSRRAAWTDRLRGCAPSRSCTTWAELDAIVRQGGADVVIAAWERRDSAKAKPVLSGLRAAYPALPLVVVHGGTAAELDALTELSTLNLGLEYVTAVGGMVSLHCNPEAAGPPARPSAAELLVPEAARWGDGRASRAMALHAALSPSGRWALGAVARTCGVSLRTAQDQFRTAGLTAKLIWESCLAFHGVTLMEAYPERMAEVAAALGVPRERLPLLIRRTFRLPLSKLVALPAAERVKLLGARVRRPWLRPLRPSEVRFRVRADVGAVLSEDRAGIRDRRSGVRHVLTGTAAQVWPLVLQGASVAEITGWIARQHRLERPAAYAEVNAAVALLIELDLIDPALSEPHLR